MQESLGADVGREHGFTDLFGFDVSPARQDHACTVARCTWGTFHLGPIAGYSVAQDRANNALGFGAQVLIASTACSGSLPGPLRAATLSAADRPRISTSR